MKGLLLFGGYELTERFESYQLFERLVIFSKGVHEPWTRFRMPSLKMHPKYCSKIGPYWINNSLLLVQQTIPKI